ncbi:hypothetical protein [Streptomyces sp. NPDC050428]|uniref:hypothetical protein n=1 Tax=Streptomyces sp. NPDC050428 TaxID=3155757 RepID=UPI00343D829E
MLLVEAGFGSTMASSVPDIVWTDIAPYVDVRTQGITITRGAQDELSTIQAGTCTLLLDNTAGDLSPGLASSPFYPNVRKGVPLRVAVTTAPPLTGSAPWPLAMLADDFSNGVISPALWPNVYGGVTEANNRARVPVNPGVVAGLQTGRQWLLTGSTLTARLVRAPAVGGSSAASASMWVNSTTSGVRLGFSYSPVTGQVRCSSETAFFDGSATVLTYSPVAHRWLRLREDSGTLYWETSADGTNWTVRRSSATPAWVGSQTQLVDFSATRTGGTADYVEWDLIGHQVHNRFWGAVNDWPTRWQGLYATQSISATDLFATLSRQPQLRSNLDEEILGTGPIAYYPLTEDSGSASAGDLSGVTAGPLGIVQVGTGGTADFGAGPGPAATGESYPLFTPASATVGKFLLADLGDEYEKRSGNQFNTIEFWFTSSTGSGRAILGLESVDLQYQIAFTLSAGGVLCVETTGEGPGPLTVYTSGSGNLADGKQHHVIYDEWGSELWVDGVSVSLASVDSMFDLRKLTVGAYRSTRLWSGSVSSVALYTTTGPRGPDLLDHYTAGITGFSGEDADVRIQRLARYGNVASVTVFGSIHDPVAGQGAGGATALSMMQEVEKTDGGHLYAERDWIGLAYQGRDVRYNPDPSSETFTVEYADLETDDVELTDDDQKQVNTVIASRPAGARQRVIDQDSIDLYGPRGEGETTLLKTTDNAVLDAANWIVSRYADPPPELREIPIEAYSLPQYPDILDGEISEYFSVTDMPAQAPSTDMRVTIEGYTETIKQGSHLIRFRASRSATDSVWVLDDAVYSVLGTTTRLAY